MVDVHVHPSDLDKFVEKIGGKENITATPASSVDPKTGREKIDPGQRRRTEAFTPSDISEPEASPAKAGEATVGQYLGAEGSETTVPPRFYQGPSKRAKGLGAHFGDGINGGSGNV
jgi:hypothetical protein